MKERLPRVIGRRYDLGMSNPDIIVARPRFRPGKKVHYFRIDRDKADRAWRRICHLDHLVGSRVIAEEMGVGIRAAALYRRAFDALDLIAEIPGEWNPPFKPEEKYKTGYEGDHGDLNSNYVDYSALNSPAEIYISSNDPDAFSRLTEGYDLYVLRSRAYFPEEASRSEYNIGMIAYGDGSRSPGGFGFFSPDETTIRIRDTVSSDDKKSIVGFRPLVLQPRAAPLGLCENVDHAKDQQERSDSPGCCFPVEKSLSQVMEMTGWSQPTAYRRLKAMGAIKVGKGRWLVGVVGGQ